MTERLMATFLGELEEQVAMMNHELLGLEVAPDDAERINSLFRIAHTLKGASRAVEVRSVERVCHALEGLLQRIIDGTVAVGSEQLSLLYAAADTLNETHVHLSAGGAIPAERIDALIDAFRSGSPERLGVSGTTARSVSADATAVKPAATGKGPAASKARPAIAADSDAGAAPLASNAPVEPGRAVRVDADRLADLLAATTRLETARGEAATQHEELEDLSDLAARLNRRWRQHVRAMRRLTPANGSLKEVEEAAEELHRLADLADRVTTGSRRSTYALSQAARDVADSTRQLRMRPFAEACEGLPRAVRDLAAAAGKEIRLEIVGGDVEADRAILDGLREPILQLVRNAVDHGIETPEARARAGKQTAGYIGISAALVDDRIAVTVADDGRGLNVAAIHAELERRGRPAPADDAELARVIFEGGLSTRGEVTAISGRGVGLDIVQHAVEQIRGAITVTWDAGAGTTFMITCPPTLTIFRAVIVSVNDQLLAVPTSTVERILRISASDTRMAEGRRLLILSDGVVPLVPLSQLLPPLHDQPLEPRPVLILGTGTERAAVSVDELIGEEEIALRPLDRFAGHVPHVSGAALLGPGRVALVLNVGSLIVAALKRRAEAGEATASFERQVTSTILVVDDSITTRTLEQSILAAAGYNVLTAVDGSEGWSLLRERGADLVVADVEMPRMDGFALCQAIRGSRQFRELPVILVTALDSAEHRARGLDAGADAYIVKSGFDQQTLLDTVRQLLG